MSAEVAAAPGRRDRAAEAQHYGTIIVVGGGCYGAYYVRQLRRAAAVGALSYRRLLVVDRDPGCRVARDEAGRSDPDSLDGAASGAPARGGVGAPPELHDRLATHTEPHPSSAPVVIVAPWSDFFERYLGDAARDPDGATGDAIVPSPLMPHLMAEWLVARARRRWPLREVRAADVGREPSLPWQRSSPDGTRYVSFAEWLCPVNCVEPALCPAIRGPRTWSMPAALRAYVAAEQGRGRALAGPVIFHCRHRAYGVGMFDTAEVLAADRYVAEAGDAGPIEVLVGSVSHCHGALRVIAVGAPAGAPTTS